MIQARWVGDRRERRGDVAYVATGESPDVVEPQMMAI
jgi:hypothetical protein